MGGLQSAICRLKDGKTADEVGLVIELLKHAPEDVLTLVLDLFNTFLSQGNVPATWRKTIFIMLAQKKPKLLPLWTSDRLPMSE